VLNPEQTQRFTQKLHQEKQRLLEQIARLENTGIGDSLSESTGELSTYDNHPADIGDELFERSKDTALRDNARVLLSNVSRALEKIKDDTYGYCDQCGRKIALDRLEALPWATQCIDCQQQDDIPDSTPRPLEEEVLAPPFQRTFLDTAESDFVGFDGEDALQAAMRYGSSDTPQDIPGSHDYKTLFLNHRENIGIVEMTDAIPAIPQSSSQKNKKSPDNENPGLNN
jgi:YteA family regulatory protein